MRLIAGRAPIALLVTCASAPLALPSRDTAAALRESETLVAQLPDSAALHTSLVATFLTMERYDDAWRLNPKLDGAKQALAQLE